MKRDWDLLRHLLTEIEEGRDICAGAPLEPKYTTQSWDAYESEMEKYRAEDERLFGHLELLQEAGYTEGYSVGRGASGDIILNVSKPRLTMAGHDLLDTMRSSKVWSWIKSTASTKGVELSFDAVKTLSALALKNVLG